MYKHKLLSIIFTFVILACNKKVKASVDNNTSTQQEKPSKVTDSLTHSLNLKQEEKKNLFAVVKKHIVEDFEIENISTTHHNTDNILYFKNFDGIRIFETDFNNNPTFNNRIKALTGNHYKDIQYINEAIVTSPIAIKNNFLAFFAGEAHNVSYNNYKLLYDLDKDIFTIARNVHDFDEDKSNILLFSEMPNLLNENEFYSLYNWVRE